MSGPNGMSSSVESKSVPANPPVILTDLREGSLERAIREMFEQLKTLPQGQKVTLKMENITGGDPTKTGRLKEFIKLNADRIKIYVPHYSYIASAALDIFTCGKERVMAATAKIVPHATELVGEASKSILTRMNSTRGLLSNILGRSVELARNVGVERIFDLFTRNKEVIGAAEAKSLGYATAIEGSPDKPTAPPASVHYELYGSQPSSVENGPTVMSSIMSTAAKVRDSVLGLFGFGQKPQPATA